MGFRAATPLICTRKTAPQCLSISMRVMGIEGRVFTQQGRIDRVESEEMYR